MQTIFLPLRMLTQKSDPFCSRSVSYEGDNFVLDGQVVRAALKSYNLLVSAPDRPLGLHSNYLRLLSGSQSNRPVVSTAMWQDHAAIIHLLEWRAALAVKSAALSSNHPDAGINHRLSKAITEAFVATQVGDMVAALNQLPHNESCALRDLYLLVSPNGSIELALLVTLTATSSTYCPLRRMPWSISLHSSCCNTEPTRRTRHKTYVQPSTLSVFGFFLMLSGSPTHSPFPTGRWIGTFRSN